jgi:hypothetical protein
MSFKRSWKSNEKETFSSIPMEFWTGTTPPLGSLPNGRREVPCSITDMDMIYLSQHTPVD